MTALVTPPHTHIVVPHFQAITEFPPDRPDIRDDCGPCANEVCIATCEGRAPTTGNMVAIRSRDINHQDATGKAAPLFRVGGGQTLNELAEDVATYTHIKTTITPFGSSVDAIHDALKAASLRGNPCVLNLAMATNLPGNEKGVRDHFVATGGIDDVLGYWVGNGDEFPFGHVGAYWVRWPDIANAQPIGLLEYHMPPPVIVTPSPTTHALSDAQLATLRTNSASTAAILAALK